MALAEKRGHRFGFTTREIDDSNRRRIVLEHNSGKLIVGTQKGEVGTSREAGSQGKILKSSTPLENAISQNQKETQNEEKLQPFFRSRPEDGISVRQLEGNHQPCSPLELSRNDGTQHSLIREKSVSIPRSHFREGLQSIVIRRPLLSKFQDDAVTALLKDTSFASDYIRTAYQEYDGDFDAMQVSIQSTSSPEDTESQIRLNSNKKRPMCRRWTNKRIRPVVLDTEGMSILGKSGNSRDSQKEESSLNESKKRLPLIDGKKMTFPPALDSNISHTNGSILLRKSWRLAISRAEPNCANAAEVFVSGINIHPVCPDVRKVPSPKEEAPSDLAQSKTDREKTVELLQLSVPVFQKKSWRGSPLLRWDEQQQMIALGRPKSVNERKQPRNGSTKDRPKVLSNMLYTNRVIPMKSKQPDKGDSTANQHRSAANFPIRPTMAGHEESQAKHNTPETMVTEQSASRRTSPSKYSSIESDFETLSDYKWNPVQEEFEPSLRLINGSPKMQGPTSNILDQGQSNRSNISVQKLEKGARFRLCKPMFDLEDYEDFQHKKFKKCPGKTRYNRMKNPTENIHYLKVQIGEF